MATQAVPRASLRWLSRSLAATGLGAGTTAYFYPSETGAAFNQFFPTDKPLPLENLPVTPTESPPPLALPMPEAPPAPEPTPEPEPAPEPAQAEEILAVPEKVKEEPIEALPVLPDPEIAFLKNELQLQREEFQKKLEGQKKKLKNLHASIEAVKSVLLAFKENADTAGGVALDAVALLHPHPDETAARLEFDSRLDELKLAAFLPDHGKPVSFTELLIAKFLATLFSFKAAEQTEGLKSVSDSYAGRNLHAIYLAREAVKKGDMRGAVFVLENETVGGVREATKDWAKKARNIAEKNQSRDLAKAAVYSRLSTILV